MERLRIDLDELQCLGEQTRAWLKILEDETSQHGGNPPDHVLLALIDHLAAVGRKTYGCRRLARQLREDLL